MAQTDPEPAVRISSLDGVAVATPPAEVCYENASQVQEELCSAVDDHGIVVMDMSASEFCDSAGVAAIVMAFRRARAAGGDLRLVMGARTVRRIFKLTGIDRVVSHFESLAAAVAARHPAVSAASARPPSS